MSRRLTVEPAGAIDGVNALFTLACPYSAASLRVWRNGNEHVAADDDGWTETSLVLGTFTMKVTPQTSDRLLVEYTPV